MIENDQLPTAVIVSDVKQGQRSGLLGMRYALVRALSDNSVPTVLTHTHALQNITESLKDNTRIVVFCESIRALKSGRKIFDGQMGCSFVLIVIPTSYAGWREKTLAWSDGLSEECDRDTVIFTDSSLSQRIIEQELASYRADVRILVPEWHIIDPDQLDLTDEWDNDLFNAQKGVSGGLETNHWSFGSAKTVERDKGLHFSGTDWGFEPRREPSPASTVVTTPDHCLDDPARTSQVANAGLVGQIMQGTSLVGKALNILVQGTKLTFIDELGRDLARHSGSNVTFDEWIHLGAPSDSNRSQALLDRSEVVIGEWARPNNVWIQERARKNQKLIVRAHRYEVTTDFPHKIDMQRYYAGVVIVPWVGRALVQQFDWPADKMVYIPNYVNSRYFHREKLVGAEFTLGIVGITPDLKRLDLALDLLEELRSEDLRYTLRVRGDLPPAHINWEKQPLQAEQWGSVLRRLELNPLLRNSVHFDAPGRDMATWYQQIGVILSTSDIEGSHVALAEGIASGALPVARNWPGIGTLWPDDFVFQDLERAAQWVLQSRDAHWRRIQMERFRALNCLDQDRVLGAWWDLVNGRFELAQNAFGPIDWTAPLFETVEA
ncbi:hypothetical protein KRR55_16460 [Paeniglutamicibacter sp. ABSL32-1]|uniref:hypothetical protein n=1 Tax=Paeniglutamicibacter quisquiliarum TaxID=2849498 RepID=UPI001C2DDB87|nr:hypothetical protein [Paeniglutamicibacter quisquiliarum]MBV1780709.1 hypothetical protein [Paeniglutamicibacter quisquiliarum]